MTSKVRDYEELLKKVDHKFGILEELSMGVALGMLNGLIVSGPPGIGKTHTIMETVENFRGANKVLSFSGHVTPLSLYYVFRDNAEESILVFDDCDSCFTNLQALNVLKAAMDTKPCRIITWQSKANDSDEQSFEFKGKVIVVTNAVLRSAHYQAFLDRCHNVTIELSPEERLAKIISIASTKHDLASDVAEDIADFIIDNYEKYGDKLSVRTFIKLHDLAKFSKRWKELCEVMGVV